MIALLWLLTQCENSDYDDVDEYGDDDNDDMTQWRNIHIRLVWLAFQVPADFVFFSCLCKDGETKIGVLQQ